MGFRDMMHQKQVAIKSHSPDINYKVSIVHNCIIEQLSTCR